jgi:RNA polymerase sigma-70 factor (ECF subfamily)
LDSWDGDTLADCRPLHGPHAGVIRRYERAVEIMPSVTREIFLANRVDGVPFRQIAAERGMTMDEIGEHIGVALRCLAAVVDGPDPWWWRLWWFQ